MRLLRRTKDGGFKLTRELTGEEIPPYAILSHTWFVENEREVTFQDLTQGRAEAKPDGYAKLRFCGEQAAKNGLEHFWVDTCCINKDSSSELSEAITAMFSWYRKAARCYAFLTDVSADEATEPHTGKPFLLHPWEPAFRQSRWFTRGWTLQELLAPESVEFFSKEGFWLGDKTTLRDLIHEITGIPVRALREDDMSEFSVNERFSWAEKRQTKRREDKAYCLLGIFNIFMPLIYGEEDYALTRLREEINKKHVDHAYLGQFLHKLPVVVEAAFNSYQNQHAPMCLPNTRTELLNHVATWAEGTDERCVFWLKGIAGTGKSTVARTVARTYYDRHNLGGSFFFSKGGGDLSKANKLATTLASQLATRIPEARGHICDAIARQEDIIEQSFRDQWEHLIIRPLSKLASRSHRSPILLVMDALDECEDGNDIRIILKSLPTARSLTNIRLRILITSRPEAVIRHGINRAQKLQNEVFVLRDISQAVVKQDISLFFETQFSTIREERNFAESWPGDRKIRQLVETSSDLFIWADTACRFIFEGRRHSTVNKRLDNLLHGHTSGAGPEKRLNEIYIAVLRAFAEKLDTDEEERLESFAVLRDVLGTIVILSSPLSMQPLSRLIGVPLSDVKDTLTDLNTIFQIPDEESLPVRLHHPSFRDFLLNKERCVDIDFLVDEKQAHKALGDKCLALMSKKLRMNICGLDSPGALVKNLEVGQVERSIPADLQYACLYWVEHYRQSGINLSDGDRIDTFFRKHFLHWLEAMNLMGRSTEQGAIIRLYHARLKPQYNVRQIPFVKDARRLMFNFQNVIKKAPLQVYCAALAFSPPTNELKFHFRQQKHPCIEDVSIAEANISKPKDDFNYVSDLAFTPDSKRIASGSNFEAVRLWDVATRATSHKYESRATDKMSAIAISPDGKTLAGGSDDFTVMAWDMETRELLYSIRAHDGWVNAVAFSPDGTLIASASMDQTVALRDATTGEEVKRFNNQSSYVNSATFSPDGFLIATGSADELIRIWDVSKEAEMLMVLDGHTGPINSVRFSPTGEQIASGSDDMTIRIWDTEIGTECVTLKGHAKKVMAVAFSSDSLTIASGSEDKTVRLWNVASGDALAILRAHTSGINSVTFSPDGMLLASSSFDDEVCLWSTSPWALVGKLDDFEEDINSGTLATRRPYLLASDGSAEAPKNFKGHSNAVTRVIFSPDGKWLASGSQDATIKIWQEREEVWSLKGHSTGIDCLLFSPDSLLVVSGSSDRTVIVWDLSTGTMSHTLEGHSGGILSVVFSPDGQLLGTSSSDKTARLWDPSSGESLGILEGHSGAVSSLVFSPDNRHAVSWSDDSTALIWDLSTKTSSAAFRDHHGPVNSVAFSPDGELLVSCAEDASICIWKIDGSLLAKIACDSLPACVAAFSPDNQLLATCSTDNIATLWNTTTISAKGSSDAGIVIRRMSFSSCGRYIETDRGTLDIKSFSGGSYSPAPIKSLPLPQTVFSTRDWLKMGTKNVLWFPDGYHATDVATSGNMVVIGHPSGSISFIRLA